MEVYAANLLAASVEGPPNRPALTESRIDITITEMAQKDDPAFARNPGPSRIGIHQRVALPGSRWTPSAFPLDVNIVLRMSTSHPGPHLQRPHRLERRAGQHAERPPATPHPQLTPTYTHKPLTIKSCYKSTTSRALIPDPPPMPAVNQNPEQIARDQIDRNLTQAGWCVQAKS